MKLRYDYYYYYYLAQSHKQNVNVNNAVASREETDSFTKRVGEKKKREPFHDIVDRRCVCYT